MEARAKKKVNLESLITNEELEQLKDIRVKKVPQQIELIGKGAYGKVYLFLFEDGSFRAGKKPKINLEDKSAKEKKQMTKHLSYALGEIKILHQLSHERIIKFFGFYLDQGQMIIFMEVMKGSVKDEINEKGCLPEMGAMNYFIQAAEGLIYLHSRRPTAIVHRDIKCENLLLTAECNVKLADFGLAIDLVIGNGSKTNLSTAPKSFVGTLLFHAPEIIQTMYEPEAYGRKSDIWSLACTLVQMISGEPPYEHLSYFEFVQRSTPGSQNPLKYSGSLLPKASTAIKNLLDSLFISDYALRPSAEKVLALAHNVARTFPNYHANEPRLQNDNERDSLRSISNGLQSITVSNQQTSVKVESAEVVRNVRKLANLYQQRITFRQEGQGRKWRRVPNVQEDSFSCRNEAEQGDAVAQNKFGDSCYFGQGVKQSYEEAVKWYSKAAEQGNAEAQYNLGYMYNEGKGIPRSDEEAAKWYTKAAEQGNADAQFCLGCMYRAGQGVSPSDEEAVKWFRKSAELGDADAQFNLGVMYADGRGVLSSYREAVEWYRKSAEQGNANAQYNLGFIYDHGKDMPQSDDEAVKWYTKSAEQGDEYAQFNLGYMYRAGRGVPQSNEEAVKWYRKAADQGNAAAQCSLGVMYEKGEGVTQSYEEAVKWYRTAAEQGNEFGQWSLGDVHENGKGVTKSDKEAVKWYRIAAEQGNSFAQNNLGVIYQYGQGVPQSEDEAVEWYRKSAEQGNPVAQFNLGWMYQHGLGVPPSDEEAVKWYRKAAEQGHAHAENMILCMRS